MSQFFKLIAYRFNLVIECKSHLVIRVDINHKSLEQDIGELFFSLSDNLGQVIQLYEIGHIDDLLALHVQLRQVDSDDEQAIGQLFLKVEQSCHRVVALQYTRIIFLRIHFVICAAFRLATDSSDYKLADQELFICHKRFDLRWISQSELLLFIRLCWYTLKIISVAVGDLRK